MINSIDGRAAYLFSDPVFPDHANRIRQLTENLLQDLDRIIDSIQEKNEKANLMIRSIVPTSICRRNVLPDLLDRLPSFIDEVDRPDERDHLYHLFLNNTLKWIGWTKASNYLENITDPDQRETAFFDCCKSILPRFSSLSAEEQKDLKKRLFLLEDQDLFEELYMDYVFLSGEQTTDLLHQRSAEFEYELEIPHFQLEYSARWVEYQKKEDASYMKKTRDLLADLDPSDEKDRVLPVLWDLPFLRRSLSDLFLLTQWMNPQKPFELIIRELEKDPSRKDLVACADDLLIHSKSGSFVDHFIPLAEIQFRFGSKDRAKDLIQRGFELIGSIENPLGRIRVFRDLYLLFKKVSKPKTAQKMKKYLIDTTMEIQQDDIFSLVQQENIYLLFSCADFDGIDPLIQMIPLIKWRLPLEMEKKFLVLIASSSSVWKDQEMEKWKEEIAKIDDPLEQATVLEELAERSGRIFSALTERIATKNSPNSLE